MFSRKNTKVVSSCDAPCVILMTATIFPPKNAFNLKITDCKRREKEYAEALEYYLSIPEQYVKGIIFAENSNSDLSRLKKLANNTSHSKMVEFIEYLNGNDFPPCYERGYGELKLIDYVVDNSEIITQDTIIWKVTGRYKLLNVIKLIKNQPEKFSIYCDLKKHRINFADTRAYAFMLQGYKKYLYGKYHKLKVRDEPKGSRNMMVGEVAWFGLIYANLHDPLIFPRFKYVPCFSGFSGRKGRNYNSVQVRSKYFLRSVIRGVFPNIWV